MMHALMRFWGMVSFIALYYFLRALRDERAVFWVLTFIFTAASVYTHLLGWAVVLTEGLYLLISRGIPPLEAHQEFSGYLYRCRFSIPASGHRNP